MSKTPGREGLDRIFTLPNLLSIGRLGLVVVFCWLLFGAHERVAAVIVLAAAGSTDFVDGYVARRFDQVTTLGKVLDPTADRIVLATGIIAIAVYGAVPPWLAGVVLGRELVVSLAVLALAALGARRIDVLWVGKAGTFGLMTCFPLFLLSYARAGWAHDLRDVTFVLLVPALALSFAAALSYVPLARRALREREETTAGEKRGATLPPGPVREARIR
ncbi:MAG: CDP-alcohol phosphatidyltransferase family protein [Acidimicrobiales bacterium]